MNFLFLQKYTDAQLFFRAAKLPGILLGLVWALCLYLYFSDYDVNRLFKPEDKMNFKNVYFLYFAITATVIAAMAVIPDYFSTRYFVRNGVLVDAKLTSISPALSPMYHSTTGQRKLSCTCSFELDGQTYTKGIYLDEGVANRLGLGREFRIVVDPAKPSRIKLLEEF